MSWVEPDDVHGGSSKGSRRRRSKAYGRDAQGGVRSGHEGSAAPEASSTLRFADPDTGRRRRAKRTSGPDASRLTTTALHEAALKYLDRYDASVEQLRRQLMKRVHKYGEESMRAEAQAAVEEVLERLVSSRLLDDERYAESYARSQRSRGASTQKVRQKLRARGLSSDRTEEALERLATVDGLSDLDAASTYARKRRLTTRYDLNDPKERNKALASLARQGFSFDIARKALGLD